MKRLTDRYGVVIVITLLLLLLSIAVGVAAASVMSPPPSGSDLQSAILGEPTALNWAVRGNEVDLREV